MIKAPSYGGSLNDLEVPAITQGKLYIENKEFAFVLTMQIAIAKVNKLEFVTDFCFIAELIYNYKQHNKDTLKNRS